MLFWPANWLVGWVSLRGRYALITVRLRDENVKGEEMSGNGQRKEWTAEERKEKSGERGYVDRAKGEESP